MELMVLQGVTSRKALATAFGINEDKVKQMLADIRAQWEESRPTDIEEARTLRGRQFDYLMMQAMKSFEMSRVGPDKTSYETRICLNCEGEGQEEDGPGEMVPCSECSGTGEVEIESTSPTALPGNPKWLALAKELVVERGKLDGAYPGNMTMSKVVKHSREIGGEDGKHIQTEVQEMVIKATPDALIEAKATIERLKDRKPDPEPDEKYEIGDI